MLYREPPSYDKLFPSVKEGAEAASLDKAVSTIESLHSPKPNGLEKLKRALYITTQILTIFDDRSRMRINYEKEPAVEKCIAQHGHNCSALGFRCGHPIPKDVRNCWCCAGKGGSEWCGHVGKIHPSLHS